VRLKNIYGRLQSKNVSKYIIDWRKNSRSKLQTKAKRFFQKYWKNHIVYEEFPVYGTKMKVDFLNATKKTAVEVNGPQHSSFNSFFHKNSRLNYLKSIKRDYKKAQWLESNGYELVELSTEDVNNLSEDFLVKNMNFLL
tara:strand:- start:81 stop:497 length:417 start_codon:yes stop_codon:yes gene_type:complete